MLHVMSARCVARNLHTTAPWLLERTVRGAVKLKISDLHLSMWSLLLLLFVYIRFKEPRLHTVPLPHKETTFDLPHISVRSSVFFLSFSFIFLSSSSSSFFVFLFCFVFCFVFVLFCFVCFVLFCFSFLSSSFSSYSCCVQSIHACFHVAHMYLMRNGWQHCKNPSSYLSPM